MKTTKHSCGGRIFNRHCDHATGSTTAIEDDIKHGPKYTRWITGYIYECCKCGKMVVKSIDGYYMKDVDSTVSVTPEEKLDVSKIPHVIVHLDSGGRVDSEAR